MLTLDKNGDLVVIQKIEGDMAEHFGQIKSGILHWFLEQSKTLHGKISRMSFLFRFNLYFENILLIHAHDG